MEQAVLCADKLLRHCVQAGSGGGQADRKRGRAGDQTGGPGAGLQRMAVRTGKALSELRLYDRGRLYILPEMRRKILSREIDSRDRFEDFKVYQAG